MVEVNLLSRLILTQIPFFPSAKTIFQRQLKLLSQKIPFVKFIGK